MYLDTNIITSLIIKDDLFDDYDKLLFNIEKYHEIVIPQIVVGETLIKIIEKSTNKNKDVVEFTKFLIEKTKFETNLPPLNDKILRMALEIKNEEPFVDYCDAVIIAHALNDGSDCSLFTTDKKVHDSQHIFELRRNLEKKTKIKVKLLLSVY
ncbi:MAG: hypothetical protein K0S93_908 [Nitrososphaeraceae archaeon]|jgi:predicted nucleic acid-binding protein|nr:hypothetical protein [Nitrososphaeraceae archaeon]